MGTRMVASGHVITAREMATSPADPFKYGRTIRYLALHQYGDEYDDWSCWPSALVEICPIGRDMARTFVKHKKLIYDAIGDFYFPGMEQSEKRSS